MRHFGDEQTIKYAQNESFARIICHRKISKTLKFCRLYRAKVRISENSKKMRKFLLVNDVINTALTLSPVKDQHGSNFGKGKADFGFRLLSAEKEEQTCQQLIFPFLKRKKI